MTRRFHEAIPAGCKSEDKHTTPERVGVCGAALSVVPVLIRRGGGDLTFRPLLLSTLPFGEMGGMPEDVAVAISTCAELVRPMVVGSIQSLCQIRQLADHGLLHLPRPRVPIDLASS